MSPRGIFNKTHLLSPKIITEVRTWGDPDPDYRRLHQHLCHAGAYAYILIMTSYGPFPFLLRAVPGSWRMLAGEVPDLAGDPCEHCPGWTRVWDAKRRRPYWFHWAHGPTWARPVGWRGTDHPFPILLLARHFRHWRRLAACGGLGWTARRELCHAAFSRWLQRYLDSPAVEAPSPAPISSMTIFSSVSLYSCVWSFEVTVTSLHPPHLCRAAVFSVKPTFLSNKAPKLKPDKTYLSLSSPPNQTKPETLSR